MVYIDIDIHITLSSTDIEIIHKIHEINSLGNRIKESQKNLHFYM